MKMYRSKDGDLCGPLGILCLSSVVESSKTKGKLNIHVISEKEDAAESLENPMETHFSCQSVRHIMVYSLIEHSSRPVSTREISH